MGNFFNTQASVLAITKSRIDQKSDLSLSKKLLIAKRIDTVSYVVIDIIHRQVRLSFLKFGDIKNEKKFHFLQQLDEKENKYKATKITHFKPFCFHQITPRKNFESKFKITN